MNPSSIEMSGKEAVHNVGNPLTHKRSSLKNVGKQSSFTKDAAAQLIQRVYRGHRARLGLYQETSSSALNSVFNLKGGGAIVGNAQNLAVSIKEKYINLSWFAVPIFFVLHSLTIAGAFP